MTCNDCLTRHVGKDARRETPVQLGSDGGPVAETEVDFLPALHRGHPPERAADATTPGPVLGRHVA